MANITQIATITQMATYEMAFLIPGARGRKYFCSPTNKNEFEVK